MERNKKFLKSVIFSLAVVTFGLLGVLLMLSAVDVFSFGKGDHFEVGEYSSNDIISEDRISHVESLFGSDEYDCTGICYCENESTRRNSVSTIKRSINYLLAATSSFVAYQLASQYFDQECEEYLRNECDPSSSIHSEVQLCTLMSAEEDDKVSSKSETSETTTEDNKSESGTVYECFGSCYPFAKYQTSKGILGPYYELAWKRDSSIEYIWERFIECKNLITPETKIEVPKEKVEKDSEYYVFLESLSGYAWNDESREEEYAKMIFLKEHLTEFCRKHTRIVSSDKPEISKAKKFFEEEIGTEQPFEELLEEYRSMMSILEQLFDRNEKNVGSSWCSAYYQCDLDEGEVFGGEFKRGVPENINCIKEEERIELV